MTNKFDRIVIVAFDGLSKKKIEKYDLGNVKQTEFGKIDLSDIRMVSGPLWGSFITGLYPKDHGIKRTMNWTNQKVQNFENLIAWNPLFEFWKGIRWTVFRNLDFLRAEVIGPYKENLRCDSTIFEDFEPSVSVNVPGYDINTALSRIRITKALGNNAPLPKEIMKRDINAEYNQRKKETFEGLKKNFALFMSHLHKSDFMQHLYPFEKEKEERLYRETDKLASKILKKCSKKDLVLFCSDHGVDNGDHTDQAFYSLNHKLGWGDPHITKIRSLLNNLEIKKNNKEISGVEV